MAMANYKVKYEDGSEQYFQADVEGDPGGEAWKDAMDAAVKNDDSPVKSVTKSDLPKTNAAVQEGGA